MVTVTDYKSMIRSSHLKECELLESVIKSVFGVSAKTLKSPSRKRNIVEARMVLFSLFRQYFSISIEQLGTLYNRNHSTVLYNLAACKDVRMFDPVFERKYLLAESLVKDGLAAMEVKTKSLKGTQGKIFLWYGVNPDGARKLFLTEPSRNKDLFWEGREVQVDNCLIELFPNHTWQDPAIMVEIKMIYQTI